MRPPTEPADVIEQPAPPAAPAGVRAAKQARSQRKHEALLQAGRRLLRTQDLASLSVARLTRDAGMSVGSFYSRFADKDAWFADLLRDTGDAVLRDTASLLDSRRWHRAGDARKVALIVQHLVAVHREHRGLLRAALSDASRAARHAAPLHGYGQRVADAVHQALHVRLQRVPAAQRRLRVGIALQLVYGTLVNAVLRDPGPIALDDARMERELTRVFIDTVRLRDQAGPVAENEAPAADGCGKLAFDPGDAFAKNAPARRRGRTQQKKKGRGQ